MKIKNIACIASILLASLSLVQGQTVLVDWTFDNAGIVAPVKNPAPSSGVDISTAYAESVGMTNTLTPTPSVGAPDVIANPSTNSDTTPSLPDAWRVRAKGSGGNTGNGWSDAAAIGTQGAMFAASTVGYTNIQLTFDVSATTQGEGLLQVQYTTNNGVNWNNAPLTYPTIPSLILTNTIAGTGTNGLVIGTYLNMVETGTYGQQWYTNVTANLSGIPGVDNNPNFAIEIVNAAEGTNCVAAAGTPLNNTSGNWSLDNVAISGNTPATLTVWDFDTYAQGSITNSPVPSSGSGVATPLGMDNSYNGTTSLPSCDVVATAGASTGASAAAWRVRGAPGNGWSSQAPIGTQGAEFDVNTLGYNNIQLSFDLYFTTQAPAQMQVEYTIDGINWSNAAALSYASDPAYIVTNASDPNTVLGTYFAQTGSQGFYTNIVATFPGITGTANFGVRIVSATTGASELAYTSPNVSAPYNNNSGNWRFDNVTIAAVPGAPGVSGSGAPSTVPVLTAATGVSVTSGSFSIAIPAGNAAWQAAITNISVGGVNLLTTSFTNGITISSTQITFDMSANTVFQQAGSLSIVIGATGYSLDTVSQGIAPGTAAQLAITAPLAAPTGNGGTLVAQPTLAFEDAYGNVATNTTATVTASAGSGSWNFGTGSGISQAAIAGIVNFTNLSAASVGAVNGAVVTFTASGFNPTNSAPFNIPAPATPFTLGNLAVLQEDVDSKNSTFSILELSPATPNQLSPVNVFPITATGTNALREASSATTGRLADSDDGTLLCFAAFEDGSSLTADETTINPRGAGTVNQTGNYVLQMSYVGLGGSTANQARSAATFDDTNYYAGDKGGIYINNGTSPFIGGSQQNVRSLKTFGGTLYALQQEGGTVPTDIMLQIIPDINGNITYNGVSAESGYNSYWPVYGFSQETNVLDFTMVRSGNNGGIYDVVYYIDGTNSTSGAIYKYYYSGTDPNNSNMPQFTPAGHWDTTNGGDGLCAAINASGGFDLYYTTGPGGQETNSVVMMHDSSPWNGNINVTSTNVLYTATGQATLKGIAFAPISPVAAPTAPSVTTLAASNITAGSATLNATVNPNGAATAYWFQYGTNASYGSFTTTNNLAAGSTPVSVTNLISGLLQGKVYHYQIVAANTAATSSGVDANFTTLAVTPPQLGGGTAFSGGSFQISFTNTPGANFSVLATTNVALPLNQWSNLGTATEVSPGQYQFSDPNATNTAQFYILESQ